LRRARSQQPRRPDGDRRGDYTGSTGGKVEDNSLGRLITLSDGVFAIATTLLALDLRVPELPDPATNTALLDELAGSCRAS
jgi:Endosomal/lysosomal potassium channel TMEM175